MTQPPVSEIVLSFNRRDETLACLEALRRQSYPALEIVVLDNGSTDGSPEAIAQEFPDARLIRMPRNYGDWEGRDIASRNCRGTYLFIIDSDAVIEPDCIERLVARMDAEPELAVVQPRIADMDSGRSYNMGFGRKRTDREFYRHTFHGCAALIRTRAFLEAGGFPHYLLGGGENSLAFRLLDRGYRVLYYPAVTARHAMSQAERVPHRRYRLQNVQRLRALVAHYPGILRLLVESAWKLAVYTVGACRRRFVLHLPADIAAHLAGIVGALRERQPIRAGTLHLIDHLTAHMVTDASGYQAIDTSRGYFLDFARRRWRSPR